MATDDALPPAVAADDEPEPVIDQVTHIGADAPDAPTDPGPPTHALWRDDGSVEYVRPEGYETADLVPLPQGFDPEIYVADPVAKTLDIDWSRIDSSLLAKVDREAGAFRTRFITEVPGQQATYLAKEDEARRWQAAEDPNAADFAMLAATAQGRAISMDEAATLILAKKTEWRGLNALIEGRREQAKREVLQATTRAAKEAAAEVNWESLL